MPGVDSQKWRVEFPAYHSHQLQLPIGISRDQFYIHGNCALGSSIHNSITQPNRPLMIGVGATKDRLVDFQSPLVINEHPSKASLHMRTNAGFLGNNLWYCEHELNKLRVLLTLYKKHQQHTFSSGSPFSCQINFPSFPATTFVSTTLC